MYCNFRTWLDLQTSLKNNIDDLIMTAWLLTYNFQNRHKIRTRFVKQWDLVFVPHWMQVTTLIRKTADVKWFIINSLHKLDDIFTIDCILHSVALHIAACILRACLNVYLYLSLPHAFWTNINRIYQREFSGVSKETSSILDPRTWTTPWIQDVNWTNTRRSEDVLDVFWTSYVR